MTRTLTLTMDNTDRRLPEFLRPGWVPMHIWEKLVYTRSVHGDRIEAVRMDTGEVFGYITHEEAQHEGRNLGNLMATRIQRHYLMKVKPELLIC